MKKDNIKYNFNLPSLSENLREVIGFEVTSVYKFSTIDDLKYQSQFRAFAYIFQEDFITDDVGFLVTTFSNNIVLVFCENEEQNSINVCFLNEQNSVFNSPIFRDTNFQYKISVEDLEASFLKKELNKKIINIEICTTKNLREGILHKANETAICFNFEDKSKLIVGFSINDEPKRIFGEQSYSSLKVIKLL